MKLNFKKLGEGQPLIILHGLFGTMDNWFTHAKTLSENYEVYLVDQRNHGLSPHSDDWTYQDMVQDLKQLMEEENIVDPIILGHSMGGKTAMLFSVQFEELLKALIVVDIAPRYYPVHHGDILKGLSAVQLDELKTRSQAEEMLMPYIEEFGVRQFLLKNLKRNPEGGYSWKMNLPVIDKNIENVGEKLIEGSYEGNSLFIRGDKSDYITDSDFDAIQEQFPQARFETVNDAGHWVHAEQPQEFLEKVKSFLDYVS